MAWVLRSFRTRDMVTLRTLWVSLVRPHQDYVNLLWAPARVASQLRVQEAPLRAFTKRMAGLKDLHYWDRLALARMYSTERRVDCFRVIYLWKMVRGLVPNIGLSWRVEGRRGLRINIPALSGSRMAIRTLKERAFAVEAPKIYNSLPQHIREFEGSPLAFKGALDALLSSVSDHPLSDSRHNFAMDDLGAPFNGLQFWLRAKGSPLYSKYIHP